MRLKYCETMMTVRFHSRRILLGLLFALSCLGVYHLLFVSSLDDVRDRVLLRAVVERGVEAGRSNKLSPMRLACQHPDLEVKNPEIYRFFHAVDPVTCEGEPSEWVQVVGSVASVTPQVTKLHGHVICSYTELVRDGDDSVRRGFTTTTSQPFTFTNSDFYIVSCTAKDGATWENTLAGIRRDEEVRAKVGWDKVPVDGLRLNVIMVGFDSLSRNTFLRTLPKSYTFITRELGAHVLQGYNVVGDGTPQQLFPILTGKTELELPEARRRMGTAATFLNTFPFIWNEFARSGYATLFAEDQPEIATFNYRLQGFDSPPTHHYMRPFFLHTYPQFFNHPRLCLHATPRHQVFFNYLYNFMSEYRDQPKFAFAFHSELSHDDYNLVSVADDDLLALLTKMRDTQLLNNTLLIVMSDHGHRFTTIRETQQGKQEERLPFLAMVLPKVFRQAHPSAADNVRMNVHRLTTPFDVHPTMMDVLHFRGARLGQVTDRGISLFSQVPPSRTCSDAYIEPHWCACLNWEAVEVSEERVVKAAEALIHYINTYTAPTRSICHQLTLSRIIWAGKFLPTKGLLTYKKNADLDGFVPDLTDKTLVSEVVYQVTLLTDPGQARFEASLTYNIKQDSYTVKMDDVSRTNKYRDQAHCLSPAQAHLRKFCYCRQDPPSNKA